MGMRIGRWPAIMWALSLVSAGGSILAQSTPESISQPEQNTNVAVVELYTSEGCDDCPSADNLLRELREEFGGRVVPLAFHVDVWDHLGWKDPFSTPEGTRRHRAVSRNLIQTTRVYTPAMVVNGQAMFGGANAEKARAEIRAALDRPAPAKVELTLTTEGKPVPAIPPLDAPPPPPPSAPEASATGVVRVQITARFAKAADRPDRVAVLVLLAEDGLSSEVTTGENKGRTLRHEGVVRWFELLRPAPEKPAEEPPKATEGPRDSLSLSIDLAERAPGINPARAWVAAVLVDESTWRVLGATRQPLPR
jgi:hypothetical protein